MADCPSMDRTGDCYVDLKDFVAVAGDWTNNLDELALFAL
jgi:hypothetical protein